MGHAVTGLNPAAVTNKKKTPEQSLAFFFVIHIFHYNN